MLNYKYFSIVVDINGIPQYKEAYIRKDTQKSDTKNGRPSMPIGFRFIPISRDDYCKKYFNLPNY